MNLIIKIFLSLFVLSAVLFSQEGTRVEKVTELSGYGTSKTQAIQNALVEAVKQKNGAYIKSVKEAFRSSSKKYVSDGTDSASLNEMNSEMNQLVKVATSGYIDSYEIVDMISHDSDFEAVIKVYTVEYRAPGNSAHKRRKIVIVPSYTQGANFRVLSSNKSSRELSDSLTQEIISSVTQTRKFSVLDRENSKAYNDEKSVILSPDAHKDEMLKLGNVLGTDYLVVSTIKNFKIVNQKTYIESIGREISKLKALATVQYQIITMATKQIKWSNTISFDFKPRGKTDTQIFNNVLQKISEDLSYEIIENVYPVKIDNISGNGDAILSQTLEVGTLYDVYSLGEKLFDSYTKEFLGYDEVKIGTVEVVRSLPKISYARVIEGDIQKNTICRKAKNTKRKSSKANKSRSSSNDAKDKDAKKYIAIKSLSISSGIDNYKHKYIKDANIAVKIKDIVNKSKKYRVLTRDSEQAKAMLDENALSNSDLSDDIDEGSIKFSNVDYQLLPKVTKFKISTSSKKIPDIDAYENSDYIKMELNIVVMDRKGEVVFESTKSDKYSRLWSSDSKLKRSKPSYKNVSKLADKLTSNVLYDLLNKKAEILSKKFITVVEVGKKTIYLDLGDSSEIEEGNEYPVYKEPTVKTIKRTGKTRLSYGEKIAVVKIDGIFDDGAEAVLVSGKISKIKEGYILRVKKKQK